MRKLLRQVEPTPKLYASVAAGLLAFAARWAGEHWALADVGEMGAGVLVLALSAIGGWLEGDASSPGELVDGRRRWAVVGHLRARRALRPGADGLPARPGLRCDSVAATGRHTSAIRARCTTSTGGRVMQALTTHRMTRRQTRRRATRSVATVLAGPPARPGSAPRRPRCPPRRGVRSGYADRSVGLGWGTRSAAATSTSAIRSLAWPSQRVGRCGGTPSAITRRADCTT